MSFRSTLILALALTGCRPSTPDASGEHASPNSQTGAQAPEEARPGPAVVAGDPAASEPAASEPGASEPAASDQVVAKPMTPPVPEGMTDPVEILRNHVEDLKARSEHDAKTVKVRHILIAHKGSGVPGVTRPIEAAEQLAAETYAELRAGADFDALLKERSDDTGGGVYGMSMEASPPAGYHARSGMVPAFGFVAWRLEVGQIGVAPLDPRKSPYGWHIVQRIE